MCVVVAGKLRRCSRIASREYFKLVIVWNSLAWTLSIWWYEHFFNIQFRVLFSVLNISSMVRMFCFDFFLARIFFAPSPFSVWIFRSFSSSLNQLHDFYGVLLWGIPIFHNFQVRSLLYITENQDYAIKKSFFKIDPNWLIRITWKKNIHKFGIYIQRKYILKKKFCRLSMKIGHSVAPFIQENSNEVNLPRTDRDIDIFRANIRIFISPDSNFCYDEKSIWLGNIHDS